jgi:hypothetical protein
MSDPNKNAEILGEQIGKAVLEAIIKAPEYAGLLLDYSADPKSTLFYSLARIHFLYTTLIATARGVIKDDEVLKQINETVLQTMLYCLKDKLQPIEVANVLKTSLPLMTPDYLELIKDDPSEIKITAQGSKRTQ